MAMFSDSPVVQSQQAAFTDAFKGDFKPRAHAWATSD
jgi:hypothetical protein